MSDEKEGVTKVVVAGSRSISECGRAASIVGSAMEEAPFDIDELVHGGARGVDTLAEKIFLLDNSRDRVTVFEPDWDTHGKAAGPIRNGEMAEYADALIAVWDGESSGTKSMIEKAFREGLDVYVKQFEIGANWEKIPLR